MFLIGKQNDELVLCVIQREWIVFLVACAVQAMDFRLKWFWCGKIAMHTFQS